LMAAKSEKREGNDRQKNPFGQRKGRREKEKGREVVSRFT